MGRSDLAYLGLIPNQKSKLLLMLFGGLQVRIVNVKKLEDCFDGSTIYSYEFDDVWTYKQIQSLEILGELSYYKDFPKPFFRVNVSGGMQIKGVEGENSCTVFFPKKGKEEMKEKLEMHFTGNL